MASDLQNDYNEKNSKLPTVTLIHSFRTTIYQVTWIGRIDFFSSTTFWFEAFSAMPYIWLSDIHTIKNIVFIVLQWKWTVTCSGLCCQAIKHSERWWQRVAFFCDLDWLVQHVWCLVRGTARLPRWIPTVNTRNIGNIGEFWILERERVKGEHKKMSPMFRENFLTL